MKFFLALLTLTLLLAVATAYSDPPTQPGSGNTAATDSIDATLKPDSFMTVDSLPQMVEETKPVYPKAAREAGIQGAVWVKVLVSRNGNVIKATVLKNQSGNEALAQAAIDAALKNKFRPAQAKGQPVAVWVTYKVEFKLEDKQNSGAQKK